MEAARHRSHDGSPSRCRTPPSGDAGPGCCAAPPGPPCSSCGCTSAPATRAARPAAGDALRRDLDMLRRPRAAARWRWTRAGGPCPTSATAAWASAWCSTTTWPSRDATGSWPASPSSSGPAPASWPRPPPASTRSPASSRAAPGWSCTSRRTTAPGADTARSAGRSTRSAGTRMPYQGQLAFPGDQMMRLSMDLGTGTAGCLLALGAALDAPEPARLPFLPPLRRPPQPGSADLRSRDATPSPRTTQKEKRHGTSRPADMETDEHTAAAGQAAGEPAVLHQRRQRPALSLTRTARQGSGRSTPAREGPPGVPLFPFAAFLLSATGFHRRMRGRQPHDNSERRPLGASRSTRHRRPVQRRPLCGAVPGGTAATGVGLVLPTALGRTLDLLLAGTGRPAGCCTAPASSCCSPCSTRARPY